MAGGPETDGGIDHEQRVIYLVRGTDDPEDRDVIDLGDVTRRIWSRRGWIAVITVLSALLALTYALLATPVYRAEVVLLPRDGSAIGLSGQLSSLAGLAGLAGLDLGGQDKQEPLGVLRSDGFVRRFIEKNDLVDVLMAESSGRLLATGEATDARKATELFKRSVIKIAEDLKSGLITVSIRWRDAAVAAQWANGLASQVNEEMRQRTLVESEANLRYLTSQLEKTANVALQQSIAKLIEAEMQKVVLARGTEEFAFRVIDAAEAPRLRQWPKRALIVVGGTVLGFCLSIVFVLLFEPVRRLVRAAGASEPLRAD